jgi:HlyD family secretion protein
MKSVDLLIFGLGLAAALTSCGKSDSEMDASGTFESTEIIISSEAAGKILKLDVQEGQTLVEGQTLGYIDTVQLYLRKRQLQASINAAQSRRPDVAVQIAGLQQQIATAKTEKKRVENLIIGNAANQKQLDDINAQIDYLQKQLNAQKLTFESSSKGINEESSALQMQVEQIEDQLRKSYITSPIKGTVLVKYAEAGELATQGKPLFKIADTDNMILRAYITANKLAHLKIGQKVNVSAEFGEKENREYNGTVSWISSKSEFTPKTIQTEDERANLVYAVKVLVKNDGYLKIGMYGGFKFEDQ